MNQRRWSDAKRPTLGKVATMWGDWIDDQFPWRRAPLGLRVGRSFHESRYVPDASTTGCAHAAASVVGAPSVHPHQHWANYPLRKDRGNSGVGGFLQIRWPLRILAGVR